MGTTTEQPKPLTASLPAVASWRYAADVLDAALVRLIDEGRPVADRRTGCLVRDEVGRVVQTPPRAADFAVLEERALQAAREQLRREGETRDRLLAVAKVSDGAGDDRDAEARAWMESMRREGGDEDGSEDEEDRPAIPPVRVGPAALSRMDLELVELVRNGRPCRDPRTGEPARGPDGEVDCSPASASELRTLMRRVRTLYDGATVEARSWAESVSDPDERMVRDEAARTYSGNPIARHLQQLRAKSGGKLPMLELNDFGAGNG